MEQLLHADHDLNEGSCVEADVRGVPCSTFHIDGRIAFSPAGVHPSENSSADEHGGKQYARYQLEPKGAGPPSGTIAFWLSHSRVLQSRQNGTCMSPVGSVWYRALLLAFVNPKQPAGRRAADVRQECLTSHFHREGGHSPTSRMTCPPSLPVSPRARPAQPFFGYTNLNRRLRRTFLNDQSW